MSKIAANEFRCFVCKEIFEKARTEGDAVAEMEALWGAGTTTDDCELVCDDCFKAMGLREP
jgi:hypothetical protein